jgi:hypothetical protein
MPGAERWIAFRKDNAVTFLNSRRVDSEGLGLCPLIRIDDDLARI